MAASIMIYPVVILHPLPLQPPTKRRSRKSQLGLSLERDRLKYNRCSLFCIAKQVAVESGYGIPLDDDVAASDQSEGTGFWMVRTGC